MKNALFNLSTKTIFCLLFLFPLKERGAYATSPEDIAAELNFCVYQRKQNYEPIVYDVKFTDINNFVAFMPLDSNNYNKDNFTVNSDPGIQILIPAGSAGDNSCTATMPDPDDSHPPAKLWHGRFFARSDGSLSATASLKITFSGHEKDNPAVAVGRKGTIGLRFYRTPDGYKKIMSVDPDNPNSEDIWTDPLFSFYAQPYMDTRYSYLIDTQTRLDAEVSSNPEAYWKFSGINIYFNN